MVIALRSTTIKGVGTKAAALQPLREECVDVKLDCLEGVPLYIVFLLLISLLIPCLTIEEVVSHHELKTAKIVEKADAG